jgi:hypothetical protein
VRIDGLEIDRPTSMESGNTVHGFVARMEGGGVFEITGILENAPDAPTEEGRSFLRVEPSGARILDRRLYERITFSPPLPAVISWKDEDGTRTGRVITFGAGGLRIETDEPLRVNRTMNFQFEVPCGGEKHGLNLSGSVVYEQASAPGYIYGVKFIHRFLFSPETMRLKRLVEQLLAERSR